MTTMLFSVTPGPGRPVYVVCRFTGATPVATVVTCWAPGKHVNPAGQLTPPP
jgi:hypothetical protein